MKTDDFYNYMQKKKIFFLAWERLPREGPAPCGMRGGKAPRAQLAPQPLHGFASTCGKAAGWGAPGGAGVGRGPPRGRAEPGTPPPERLLLSPAAPRGQPRPGGSALSAGDAEPHIREREII